MIGKPYAYDVIDLITGQHVLAFRKPLLYSLTRPDVTAQSTYWNTGSIVPPQVEKNPRPLKIEGDTLSQVDLGSIAGWFVTSPL